MRDVVMAQTEAAGDATRERGQVRPVATVLELYEARTLVVAAVLVCVAVFAYIPAHLCPTRAVHSAQCTAATSEKSGTNPVFVSACVRCVRE